jgi:Pex19 protein family
MDEQNSKINAALDAALDELDSDSDEYMDASSVDRNPPAAAATAAASSTAIAWNKNKNAGAAAPPPSPSSPDAMLETMMQHMMEGGKNDEDFMGRILGEMEAHIRSEVAARQEQEQLSDDEMIAPPAARRQEVRQVEEPEQPNYSRDDNAAVQVESSSSAPANGNVRDSSSKRKHSSPPPATASTRTVEDLDDVIGSMFADIRSRQADLERKVAMEGLDFAPPALPDDEEEDDDVDDTMLKNLMKGLEGLNTNDGLDADSMLDGIMEQLLSKELMYQPMKQVADRFPSWLEENKLRLTKDEYSEYVVEINVLVLCALT